jgi:uncharacterized OsmC-like protein
MKITSKFNGALRFDTEVRGHVITMDNPVDAGGSDAGPTPPEFLVASLTSCVGIYAVFFCNKYRISPEGMEVTADYEKASAPARVGKINIVVSLPAGVPVDKNEAFMKTIQHCMVHNTLEIAPAVTMTLAQK